MSDQSTSSAHQDHQPGVLGTIRLLRQAADYIESHGAADCSYWVNGSGKVEIRVTYYVDDD